MGLSDELLAGAKFHPMNDGYQLAWVNGRVAEAAAAAEVRRAWLAAQLAAAWQCSWV